LAVADNDVAKLSFRVEFVEEPVRVARPRDELVFHLNSGLRGEIFRKLHQGVGRIPRRPAQRQLFCLSNSLAAKTRGGNNRGNSQSTHHLDHYTLPVVAGDCLLALPITLRHSAEMHAGSIPPLTEVARIMFSVLVKLEIFTKQFLSQWTPAISFRGEVIRCSATIIGRRRVIHRPKRVIESV
jgi:hypothetical protein